MKVDFKNYWNSAKNFVVETPVEVFILGSFGFIMGTTFGYRHEAERAMRAPLGFSEKSQIELEASREGSKVGNGTNYLTSLSDAVMKIYECSNESNKGIIKNSKRRFALELEMRMDPNFKEHHYNLNDLLDAIPGQAEAVLSDLSQFIDARNRVKTVNRSFDNAWDDSHTDHYRTEVYTESETFRDSNGNLQTRTVTKTRQVYDHTTHRYRYNLEEGERASQALNDFNSKHRNLKFTEELKTASKTNAEGEYAAEVSRQKKGKLLRLSPEQHLDISNTWNTGSTLLQNLPEIYDLLGKFEQDANAWTSAKETAKSKTYNTFSHSDDGPIEFRVTEETLSHGRKIEDNITEIISGIEFVRINTPKLRTKIEELIAIELDRKKGNSGKVRKEIMDLTEEFYNLNFANGFEMDRFRAGMVLLCGLLGLAAFSGVGIAVDYGVDKYHRRNPIL